MQEEKKNFLFIPDCPKKKKGCNGIMQAIKGEKEAWYCPKCKSQVWIGDIPTWGEIHDRIHSNTKELMSLEGPISKKGGSRNGRRRKKKKPFIRKYYFEDKPQNLKK